MEKWISVKKSLPPLDEEGESDYLLCIDSFNNSQVVCWYNDGMGWIVAHHKADNLPINVSHWRTLPKPPKF